MQTRVVRTYLALRRVDGDGATAGFERRSPPTAGQPAAAMSLQSVADMDPAGYRALYDAVGRDYNWRDRLAWSDARLASYLADPTVAIWQLTVDGSAAGYFELRQHGVELPGAALAFRDADPASAASPDSAPQGDDAPVIAPLSARPCELVYFGLVRGAQGRGLGRWLLEQAIDRAWAGGADLLWLHTCSLDHQAAIPNYRARGFRPFATFVYDEEVFDSPTPATGDRLTG